MPEVKLKYKAKQIAVYDGGWRYEIKLDLKTENGDLYDRMKEAIEEAMRGE